jgi:hypothetical protein
MCFPQAPEAPPVIKAPTKTAADIQRESEFMRQRLSASTRGIESAILTAGYGDTSPVPTRGVVVGGS